MLKVTQTVGAKLLQNQSKNKCYDAQNNSLTKICVKIQQRIAGLKKTLKTGFCE